MTRESVPFEEIPSLKGEVVVGQPFVVGSEDQENFEVATWLDRAYAEDVPEFPEKIIEGFHALSLIDAVIVFNAPGDRETSWGLNYGLDKVRFVSPLWLDQPIVPTIECLDVKEKQGGFLVLRRVTFQHEGADKPGMVADWWGFVQKRGQPSIHDEGGRQH